jgi:crossover junction endodeoxyribonuclease RuvC
VTRVIGLDLSLSSTGVACNAGWVERIRLAAGPVDKPFLRLRAIRARVLEFANTGTDLVVVEGLAISRQTGQHLTRAGMWHLVMEAVDARTPWIQVSPTALKKYATGRGNAGKDEVLAAAVRRFPHIDVKGNDEADALWLAAIGADLLGEPMVEMPALNRSTLAQFVMPAGVA